MHNSVESELNISQGKKPIKLELNILEYNRARKVRVENINKTQSQES